MISIFMSNVDGNIFGTRETLIKVEELESLTNGSGIYLVFIFLLITQAGHLMAPMKSDKSRTSKPFVEDEKVSMNHSAEFSANSINDEYLMEPNANKTFFRSLNNSVIVSQVGSIVHIPCRVHLIGDQMVKTSSFLPLSLLIS